jgi:hypothetical protein
MTYIFESDMTNFFLNKRNLKPYSNSILSVKTGHSDFQNQTLQFFATSAFGLELFSIDSLPLSNICPGLKHL